MNPIGNCFTGVIGSDSSQNGFSPASRRDLPTRGTVSPRAVDAPGGLRAKLCWSGVLVLVLGMTHAAWAQTGARDTAVDPIQHRAAGAFPRVGDFEVLRGDFHIHTFHSDGRQTSKQRVFEAWQHGYDVIAITDHGNYRAYEEARPWADALGLILLRGLETGVHQHEHLVALGFADTYVPRDPHHWAETSGAERAYYRDQLEQLTRAGAFVLYAHPHVGWRDPMKWAVGERHLSGIEVKNTVVGTGWATVESHGTWCYPFAFDWALEHDLALFANSDIHADRGEADQPVTLVLVSQRSAAGVMEAFGARRTVAWFNGMLWGREDLLTNLLRGLISVEAIADPDNASNWVRLRNQGPVPLAARVSLAEAAVSLAPYGEVLLAGTTGDTLTIGWTNVWVASNQTIKVDHAVRANR